MTTDLGNGAYPGSDGISDAELRPYSAPQLVRLDTRATALTGSFADDGVGGSSLFS